MATNTEYITQVENYLSDGMSSSQKTTFENELANNSSLKSELNHQSELINGIQSFRKAELKTRLAAINVNPTILGIISQATAIKTAAIAVTGVLIATGAYLYIESQKSDFELQKVNSINEYMVNEIEIPEESINIEPFEVNQFEKGTSTIEVEEVAIPKTKISTIQSPDFTVPNSPEASDSESMPATEEIVVDDSNNLENLAEVGKLDKVEVQNIVDKKYKFHYQYLEGKLYLYGKFDQSPYEIIEINGKKGKNLFFFYQDRYYKVKKNTSEITAFEMISDLELIKELKILKAK